MCIMTVETPWLTANRLPNKQLNHRHAFVNKQLKNELQTSPPAGFFHCIHPSITLCNLACNIPVEVVISCRINVTDSLEEG